MGGEVFVFQEVIGDQRANGRTDKVMCGGRFAPKSKPRSAKTAINRHGATDSIILPLGRGRAILSGPVLALGHMRVGPFPIQQYKDSGKQYI